MNFVKRYRFIIILITGLFSIPACDGELNIFSDADDVALGKQVVDEINGNPAEYPVYGDKAIKNYLNNVVLAEILNSPKIAKKNVYSYSIEVIDKPDVLNAFALPGGPIYVYTGLLKYLDNEAALAGVLGHEIAHAERRHATQRMTQYYGVSMLLSLVLGDKPTQLAEIAANLFVGLAFLANSRSNEDESDDYSVQYLMDTKYYPGGVKFFFEQMRDDNLVSSQPNKLETFLSTHPDPISRISTANTRLTQNGITVYDWRANVAGIFREEYITNIKSRIP